MFSNKPNATSNKTDNSSRSEIKAFLGAGSEFEGRMTFNENMRIDGAFRGEITSQDLLVIGETGQIHAEVSVGSIVISGVFQGALRAKSSIRLKAPAKVKGELISPSVSIEEGVVFDGSIQMSKQAQPIDVSSQPQTNNSKVENVALVGKSPKPPTGQDGEIKSGTLL